MKRSRGCTGWFVYKLIKYNHDIPMEISIDLEEYTAYSLDFY